MSDEYTCDLFSGGRGCNLREKQCHKCPAAIQRIEALEAAEAANTCLQAEKEALEGVVEAARALHDHMRQANDHATDVERFAAFTLKRDQLQDALTAALAALSPDTTPTEEGKQA